MLSAVALPRHRSWRAAKENGGSLFPSPRGLSVLFLPSRQGNMDMGGWLIDAAAGRSVAFLEPPVYQAAWSPDGSTLAVAPASGFLGTDAPPSILLLDENGRERSRIPLGDDCHPIALYWTRDGIVCPVSRQAFGIDLFVVSPASGEKCVIHVQRDWGSWGIAGPTTDGKLYIAMTAEGVRQKWDERGHLRPTPYWLYALDTKAGSIGSRPIIAESEGEAWLASARLSPSGRYWVREPRGRFDQATVVRDLVTGAEVEMGRLHQLAWLDGERAFWTERMGGEARLVSAHPGETPQPLRTWNEARIGIGLQPSPDRARLLVSVWRVHGQGSAGPGGAGGSQAGVGGNEARICGPPDEETVFEPASGRWTELPAWKTSCPLPSTPVAPST